LGAGPGTKQSLQKVGPATTSVVLSIHNPQNNPWKVGQEKWLERSEAIWVGTERPHPSSTSLQLWLCQKVPECPNPDSQLPVKPEAGHSGEGPRMWPARCRDITATVPIMAHKQDPSHIVVFVEETF
jgi:hypothetical protein